MPQRSAALVARDQLVIAHQRDLAAAQIETAHSVSLVRYAQPVGHRIAQSRKNAVGEALRQIEHSVGVADQCTITCLRAASPCHIARSHPAVCRSHAAPARTQRGKGAARGGHKPATVEREIFGMGEVGHRADPVQLHPLRRAN